MRRPPASAVALLLFLSPFAAAKPFKPKSFTTPPRFTVQLSVEASNISKEDIVDDYTNAFKKLSDVQVTGGSAALWVLYINVTPVMDKTGIKGYVMSVVIADRYATQTLMQLPADDFKTPTAQETVQHLAEDSVKVREHLMVSSTVQDFARSCDRVVSHFDQTYLMPVREAVDNYNESRPTDLRRSPS